MKNASQKKYMKDVLEVLFLQQYFSAANDYYHRKTRKTQNLKRKICLIVLFGNV